MKYVAAFLLIVSIVLLEAYLDYCTVKDESYVRGNISRKMLAKKAVAKKPKLKQKNKPKAVAKKPKLTKNDPKTIVIKPRNNPKNIIKDDIRQLNANNGVKNKDTVINSKSEPNAVAKKPKLKQKNKPNAVAKNRKFIQKNKPNTVAKKPKLKEYLTDRFIIVPEYKLMFCYAEKVGCSMFNKLFRDLRLLTGEMNERKANFQKEGIWWRNTPGTHGLNTNQLEAMMVDPEWTKAMFYRDPVDRFLSAFRSKCVEGMGDWDGPKYCNNAFKKGRITLADAMKYMQTNKLNDPHFGEMQQFCGGLNNDTMPLYDVVERLDKATSAEKVGALLKKVGVPTEIVNLLVEYDVKTGGHSGEGSPIKEQIAKKWNFEHLRGRIPGGHETGASKVGDGLDANALRTIKNYYANDYGLIAQYG